MNLSKVNKLDIFTLFTESNSQPLFFNVVISTMIPKKQIYRIMVYYFISVDDWRWLKRNPSNGLVVVRTLLSIPSLFKVTEKLLR